MPTEKSALPVSIATPIAKQFPLQWQCLAMYLGEEKRFEKMIITIDVPHGVVL